MGQTKDALILRWLAEDPDSFQQRVIDRLIKDDCWLWSGAVHSAGYGLVAVPAAIAGRRVLVRVHRAVYLWQHGPIAENLVIDHDMRGCPKLCANPHHLTAVTAYVNTVIASAHPNMVGVCKRGHQRTSGGECIPCRRQRDDRRGDLISAAAKSLGLTQREYKQRHGSSTTTARNYT